MKVIITRPYEQGLKFAEKLNRENISCILSPTLEIIYNKVPIDLNKYSWIVFTSPRGVVGLKKCLVNNDIQKIKDKKIGVIGIETSKKFKEVFNREVDVIPKEYTAENLLKELKKYIGDDDKILLPTTPSSRDVLSKNLNCDVVYIYRSEIPIDLKDKLSKVKKILLDDYLNNEKDVITFTSGLTAKNFFENIDNKTMDVVDRFHHIVAIGPITEKTIRKYVNPNKTIYIPKIYTVEGMIEVIKSLK